MTEYTTGSAIHDALLTEATGHPIDKAVIYGFDLDELLPAIPADHPIPAGSPMYNPSDGELLLVYFDGQWHRKPYRRRIS